MFFEPHLRDRSVLPHNPFKAIVGPRPIGWISTLSIDGTPNLAPYSFFNIVSEIPPIVMFSSHGMKHTASNALRTKEFVVNMATASLSEAVKKTGEEIDSKLSEFDAAGLGQEASTFIAPPRVSESPVALECRVTQSLHVNDQHGEDIDYVVILGEVVGIHVADHVVTGEGLLDILAMEVIGRFGYRNEYTVANTIIRPN